MTTQIIDFLKQVKETIGQPHSILEVGSLNINGSAREVFQQPGIEYYGIDQEAGKDVDEVVNIRDFNTAMHYDLIICCEVFEHDPLFWKSLEKMKSLLKPGGWMIITTPGFFTPKHNHPHDYYRFLGQTYYDVFFNGFEDVWVGEFYSWTKPESEKPDWVGGFGKKPKGS